MSIDELCHHLDLCAPWTPALGECLQAAGCECDCAESHPSEAEQAHFPKAAP
jgi:hypothetical protein